MFGIIFYCGGFTTTLINRLFNIIRIRRMVNMGRCCCFALLSACSRCRTPGRRFAAAASAGIHRFRLRAAPRGAIRAGSGTPWPRDACSCRTLHTPIFELRRRDQPGFLFNSALTNYPALPSSTITIISPTQRMLYCLFLNSWCRDRSSWY